MQSGRGAGSLPPLQQDRGDEPWLPLERAQALSEAQVLVGPSGQLGPVRLQNLLFFGN